MWIPSQRPDVSKAAARAATSTVQHKPTATNTQPTNPLERELEDDSSETQWDDNEENDTEHPTSSFNHGKSGLSGSANIATQHRGKDSASLGSASQSRLQNSLPPVTSTLPNLSLAQHLVSRRGGSGFSGNQGLQPLSAKGSGFMSSDIGAKYKREDLKVLIPERQEGIVAPCGVLPMLGGRQGVLTPNLVQWTGPWTPTAAIPTARGDNTHLGLSSLGGDFPETLGLGLLPTPAALTSAHPPLPSPSGAFASMNSRSSGSVLGKRLGDGIVSNNTPIGQRHRLV